MHVIEHGTGSTLARNVVHGSAAEYYAYVRMHKCIIDLNVATGYVCIHTCTYMTATSLKQPASLPGPNSTNIAQIIMQPTSVMQPSLSICMKTTSILSYDWPTSGSLGHAG